MKRTYLPVIGLLSLFVATTAQAELVTWKLSGWNMYYRSNNSQGFFTDPDYVGMSQDPTVAGTFSLYVTFDTAAPVTRTSSDGNQSYYDTAITDMHFWVNGERTTFTIDGSQHEYENQYGLTQANDEQYISVLNDRTVGSDLVLDSFRFYSRDVMVSPTDPNTVAWNQFSLSISARPDDQTASSMLTSQDLLASPLGLLEDPHLYSSNIIWYASDYALYEGVNTDYNDLYQGVTTSIEVVSTVVPIPAAAWLFGSALAGLGWLRRRQIS